MKNQITAIIALNVLALFITTVMFGAGFYADNATHRMKSDLRKAPVLAFERRLESRIGGTYTRGFHEGVIAPARATEEMVWALLETMGSYSRVMFRTGGAIALLSLVNLFLLWKVKRYMEAAAVAGHG